MDERLELLVGFLERHLRLVAVDRGGQHARHGQEKADLLHDEHAPGERPHGQDPERRLPTRDRHGHPADHQVGVVEGGGLESRFFAVVLDDHRLTGGDGVPGLRGGIAGDRSGLAGGALAGDPGGHAEVLGSRDPFQDAAVRDLEGLGDSGDGLVHQRGRIGARERVLAQGGHDGLLMCAFPGLFGCRGPHRRGAHNGWSLPILDPAPFPSPQGAQPFIAPGGAGSGPGISPMRTAGRDPGPAGRRRAGGARRPGR